ncbi:MAG TPA: SpoIIE family protein phosphatase [Planctomycetota bacterium]|nr:SpoIIE family protein phosphatase [Planctomycetota bacterium]
MMVRSLSMRSRLVGILLLVIVVFGGAVFVLTALVAQRAVQTLSKELIARQADGVADRLESFFAPVQGTLSIGESWGKEGILDPDKPEELRTLLRPVLERFRQITAALVADDRGHEFMLLRAGDKWSMRQTRPDEWGTRVKWADLEDGRWVEAWKDLDYDPRRRPWYQGAVANLGDKKRIFWTEPYTFFTTRKPGITAAAAFPTGDRVRVVGFDVLLEDISKFTMSLGFLDEATIFVVTAKQLVVGLPRQMSDKSVEARDDALLHPVGDLGVPVLTDALAALPLGQSEAARFRSGGETWWGGRRSYGPDLEITVAVPERKILSGLEQTRVWLGGVMALILLFALWRAISLARRFAKPIEKLVAESERLSRGDLEPGQPIATPITELRRLADAQDRMRESLKKLVHLEGELRVARMIQQQTFPRSLPELPGFECAGFTLPAAETGGDTYDGIGMDEDRMPTNKRAARGLFLVADATGHGLGPALSVTQVRSMLRMAVRTGRGLEEIVRNLNEQLHDDLESGRFVTAWFGELDARARTLTSFSAGQGPLLRYDAARAAWEERNSDLPPLGIVAPLKVKVPPPLPLGPGDLFLVLSDGFFEAAAPGGELFGADRVREIVERLRAEPAARILAALKEAVDAHLAGAPAADDRTALLIKGTPLA